MQQWLECIENDDSCSLGDEMEDVKYPEDEESADELDLPYWVTAVSLPKKFDPKPEEFVPEECDPGMILVMWCLV